MAATQQIATVEEQAAPAPAGPPSETAVMLSMIERAARDPSVDIDKMERLLNMQQAAIQRAPRPHSTVLCELPRRRCLG